MLAIQKAAMLSKLITKNNTIHNQLRRNFSQKLEKESGKVVKTKSMKQISQKKN